MNHRLLNKRRLLDALWLTLLILLVFAIQPSFHGDEPMLIYVSRDFTTAFTERNPAALMVDGSNGIDSDAQLRLLNGTIHRYATGLIWTLAGATVDQLPPRPGWDWGLDYDTNVATGHYPNPTLLASGRLASSIFLSCSIIVMFAIGWQFGGRWLAWLVSGLYIINPIVLLNGRRSVQEGALLCFGLLVILVAVYISKRRSDGTPAPLYLWLLLGITGALAAASKHPGIVFTAGAFSWVFLVHLLRWNWRDMFTTIAKLLLSGAVFVALFIALSPALWNNPPARFIDLLRERAMLLDVQVRVDPLAPTTIMQRIEGIFTQPFMTPPQHFEVAAWATYPPVMADVDRYMASPLSGVQFGVIGGGLLTLMALVGIVFSLRRDWRVGVLAWLLVTIASLLSNPLPWQRYYLPLIPVMTLLAGIGIYELARRFIPRFAAPLEQPEAAKTPNAT